MSLLPAYLAVIGQRESGDPNLLVDWDLGAWGGSGTIPNTGAGGTLPLTVVGATASGGQMSFDGVDDYANIASKTLFNRVHQVGDFELLIEGQDLLESGTPGNSTPFGSCGLSNSQPGFFLWDVGGSLAVFVNASYDAAESTSLFFTRKSEPLRGIILQESSGTLNVRALYDSGNTQGSATFVARPATMDSVGFFHIGRNGSGNYSKSKISRVRLWDTPQTIF